jgi:hypothetical protein
MKRVTINPGDTMWQITHDAKVYVGTEWWSWYSKHCNIIKGKSILPNLLYPGDIIEIPEKGEWAKIKAEGERVEARNDQPPGYVGKLSGVKTINYPRRWERWLRKLRRIYGR